MKRNRRVRREGEKVKLKEGGQKRGSGGNMKVEKGIGREGRKKIEGKEGDNFMFPVTLVPLPLYYLVKNFVRKKPQENKCGKRGLVRKPGT